MSNALDLIIDLVELGVKTIGQNGNKTLDVLNKHKPLPGGKKWTRQPPGSRKVNKDKFGK
jgi:hypothetical protein